MSKMSVAKRAARITEARLTLKRAENFRYGQGGRGNAEQIVIDLRLALKALLEELEQQ